MTKTVRDRFRQVIRTIVPRKTLYLLQGTNERPATPLNASLEIHPLPLPRDPEAPPLWCGRSLLSYSSGVGYWFADEQGYARPLIG